MTLDEAIAHSEETAAEKEAQAEFYKTYLSDEVGKLIALTECQDCAHDHRQLAEWLKELRQYCERNTKEAVYSYAPGTAVCPTCGQKFFKDDSAWKADYCFHCGQKLWWLMIDEKWKWTKPIEQKG